MRFHTLFACVPLVASVVLSHSPRSEEPSQDTVVSSLTDRKIKQVAVIGAGSAGASTAYFLNKFEYPSKRINITVYERSNYVGGRSTTVDAYDDPSMPLELGASIFVKVNKNLVTAAEDFGLSYAESEKASADEGDLALGVWDGKEFVFTQKRNQSLWQTIGQLVWKYGLSPFRGQNLMKKTVGDFLKLYNEPHFPFYDLGSAAAKVGLTDALTTYGNEFLEKNRVYPPFSTEVVQAATRVNYAQNLQQIHGLETMVSIAADGAMSIAGGNWKIFAGMIKASGAHLELSTAVTSISKQPNGRFLVTSKLISSNPDLSQTTTSTFDAVVIAAPFQFSDIKLTPSPAVLPKATAYVKLYVTIFTSPHRISPKYFNSASAHAPDTILTTLANHSTSTSPSSPAPPFFSISTLRRTFNPHTYPPRAEYAYKIFSPAPLTASFISALLDFPLTEEIHPGAAICDIAKEDVSWFHYKVWDSYPYMRTRESFDGPALGKGLWYTAGIEGFISTMETSSLMGANVAKLMVEEWRGEEGEGGFVVQGRERTEL
ncbi:MAG: hypothetical protein MMC23_002981 [Stictis urceolatum]|nr:hypothetical protein [Stictis urceolata]